MYTMTNIPIVQNVLYLLAETDLMNDINFTNSISSVRYVMI